MDTKKWCGRFEKEPNKTSINEKYNLKKSVLTRLSTKHRWNRSEILKRWNRSEILKNIFEGSILKIR